MAKNRTELIQEGADITVTLTDEEKTRFKECEQIIKADLKTFLQVGRALAEIHDYRLYRETHKTFEKYCKDVWDLGQSTAYQKIDGYNAVALLEQKSSAIAELSSNQDQKNILITINEAQARQLTKLKKNPEDQVKAWGLVLEQLNQGKKLTAALVNKAVKEVRGEVTKRKINKTKKAVETTSLLSKQFKYAHQMMLDIITAEKDSEWATSKRKEAVKWLQALVKMAESDD